MRKQIVLILLLGLSVFSVAQSQRNGKGKYELHVSFYTEDISSISEFVEIKEAYSLVLNRVFSISDEKLASLVNDAIRNRRGKSPTTKIDVEKDFASIYKLRRIFKVSSLDNNVDLTEIAERLNTLPQVEYASLVPLETQAPLLNNPVYKRSTKIQTPNLEQYQFYLEPDFGVNMKYAWNLGATGKGIRVRDVEPGFNENHEEFNGRNIHMGESFSNLGVAGNSETEHATAVAGVIFADKGDFGISGMAYDAEEFVFYPSMNNAIEGSSAGDVIVVVAGGADPNDVIPSCWDMYRAASDAGIIIVEAAGNMNINLDSESYNNYNAKGSSGAIIVGAGNPKRHSRWGASNYGKRIDVQGWGDSVATCGGMNFYYNNINDFNSGYSLFTATSAAASMVTGCVVVLQSYYHELTGNYMTSEEMRNLLVETGTPQTGDTTKHIGPLPNMKNAIKSLNRPYVNLEGVVKRENGKIIEGANITIEELDDLAKTDSEGEYTFIKLPAGSYKITASKEGFQTEEKNVTVKEEGEIINLDFVLKGTVGINNVLSCEINIYPNPVSDILYVESLKPLQEIIICDMNGRILKQVKNAKEMDISEFRKGIYMLKIILPEVESVHKIIKI